MTSKQQYQDTCNLICKAALAIQKTNKINNTWIKCNILLDLIKDAIVDKSIIITEVDVNKALSTKTFSCTTDNSNSLGIYKRS